MNKVLIKGSEARRFQAYGAGTGRSGTRSMAGIFSKCYRSAHEPNVKELLAIITALQRDMISKEDFRKYALYLDNKLQLEFNSSYLNAWQLGVLVTEFPDAKFILTIRDCYSWLNSLINDLYFKGQKSIGDHERFLNMALGKGTQRYAKEESILCENGSYTLDGLLSYWAKVNNEILAAVPKSRLLVIKTPEISDKTDEIADFLNISPATLDLTRSHMNKSTQYPDLLSRIDKDHLLSKVNLHCKALMDEFFPGFIHTFE